jgi:lysophospholipase L1-like esterase
VGGWQDQSGNGFHATQATAGNRPALATATFNGNPGVLFAAASSQWMSNATLTGLGSAAGATAFAVFSNNTGNFCTAFKTAAGLEFDVNNDRVFATTGNFSYAEVASTIRVPRSMAGRFDGTLTGNARIVEYRSGAVQSPSYPGNPPPATLGAGTGYFVGSPAGANQYLDGPLFELLIYNRALTDPEVAQVHAYIAAKWFAALPSSVICSGDSLTTSYPVAQSGGTSWQTALGTLLGSGWTAPESRLVTITSEVAAQTSRIATLATHADYYRQPYRPQDWFILWGGINDLQASVAPATVLANLISIATARAALGFKVAVMTVTDRSDSPPGGFEAARTTLNNSIVAQASTHDRWPSSRGSPARPATSSRFSSRTPAPRRARAWRGSRSRRPA